MKKWQKNPWCTPSNILPFDVVEYDVRGNKLFGKSYRRFDDAWSRFTKAPEKGGWIEFRRLNKVDADMTTVFTHDNNGIKNVVEWRNLDKVGMVKV